MFLFCIFCHYCICRTYAWDTFLPTQTSEMLFFIFLYFCHGSVFFYVLHNFIGKGKNGKALNTEGTNLSGKLFWFCWFYVENNFFRMTEKGSTIDVYQLSTSLSIISCLTRLKICCVSYTVHYNEHWACA